MTPVRTAAVEAVAAFSSLGLQDLRSEWASRYGDPPSFRSVELLRHMLAWRVQEETFGGLDGGTQQALRRSSVIATRARLAVGSRIAREHRGVTHEVEVTDTGFRYGGVEHDSLSAIARTITGVRWNGWRFFGLTEEQL